MCFCAKFRNLLSYRMLHTFISVRLRLLGISERWRPREPLLLLHETRPWLQPRTVISHQSNTPLVRFPFTLPGWLVPFSGTPAGVTHVAATYLSTDCLTTSLACYTRDLVHWREATSLPFTALRRLIGARAGTSYVLFGMPLV